MKTLACVYTVRDMDVEKDLTPVLERMASSAKAPAPGKSAEDWDSDGSLSWEDFFGKSTELVPTLLGMYDALVGRSEDAVDADATAVGRVAPTTCPSTCPPPGGGPGSGPGGGVGGGAEQPRLKLDLPLGDPILGVPRPLSVSSIASSSSSSSGSSIYSGHRRLGQAPKSSAYLASIESLEDTDDESGERDRDRDRDRPSISRGKTAGCAGSQAGSGSGDSGVCSPCSPCSRFSDHHPHLSFMDRVVMEIIETEGVYVRDLQQIIVGYLSVWQCHPDCPLGASQLDALFGNIQDIYRFNYNFLRQLELCALDPVQVARCFVRNNKGFSIYTEYCTNYPRTVSVLTELMRREHTVRLFRERQAALQHTLPLGSYLLKPVQRILKYHLLLQNIVKHSSCDLDGYGDIVNALSTMTGIAHHINDMKRRHEHAVRVQEIQSLLYGWEGEDLTTFGELCAEGTFRVAGAKALRHAFLFDKMLLITKKKEESTLGYKAHIMCSNLMLIESVVGEPFSFHVIPFDNPRMQYTLQARNLEQKREWTLQLKRVILENYNAVIPTHARQLVMELGQNRSDAEISADKVTPRRQHSAPEYLEKRKQERERRKSETGLRYRLRRNRKSDPDTIAQSATRRGRRGSSSSRDGEGEESVQSLADKTRDRFASWRRKSEPPCYSNGNSKRHVTIDLQIPEGDAVPLQDAGTAEQQESELPPGADTSAPDDHPVVPGVIADETQVLEETQSTGQTIEEIVSQLLMQNREFQKILKKQQRQINLRHRITAAAAKEETSDEEEAIYETLSALATVHHQQRLGVGAGRSKALSECSNDEDDYVTLVCRSDVSTEQVDVSRSPTPAETPEVDDDMVPTSKTDSVPTTPEEAHTHLTRARLKQLRNRSSVLEEKENARNGLGLGFAPYDNLQSIWERLRRSQRKPSGSGSGSGLDERGEGELERLACRVRRAASFNSQHSGGSGRMSHFYIDTPSVSVSPISPAAWLKQQGPHLVAPAPGSTKSGSLPRSFQMGPEGEALPGRSKETLRARILRNGRSCPDRPFTIASDKPSRLNMQDMEGCFLDEDGHRRFPVATTPAGDTTEDDSLTEYTATPNASLHELNVHPEYKIYRPSISRASLKHVLASMSKLAGLRVSSEALEHQDWDRERERALQRERRANRIAAVVVKQYSKTLRRRIRNLIGDDPSVTAAQPEQDSGQKASFKQGGSGLGARIAHCSETSEYADPRLLFHNIRPSKKAAALLGIRPESVLSVSSNLTTSSSSDGDKTSGFGGSVDTTTRPIGHQVSDGPESASSVVSSGKTASREDVVESDGSADSFYERSFEAMESLLETDVFRDSAVFSDHDDTPDSDTAPNYPPPLPPGSDTMAVVEKEISVPPLRATPPKAKVPPPVPAKPRGFRSSFRSEVPCIPMTPLVCRLSSDGASREDDCDTSSASTVVEVAAVSLCPGGCPGGCTSCPPGLTSKGWVKHVIGRLQGDSSH